LVELPDQGYAAIGPAGTQDFRRPDRSLVGAIKLCRFALELDPYIPDLHQLPAEARLWPGAARILD